MFVWLSYPEDKSLWNLTGKPFRDLNFDSIPFPTELRMQFDAVFILPSHGFQDYKKVHHLHKGWVNDEGISYRWKVGSTFKHVGDSYKVLFQATTQNQMYFRSKKLPMQVKHPAFFATNPEYHKVILYSEVHQAFLVQFYKSTPNKMHASNEEIVQCFKFKTSVTRKPKHKRSQKQSQKLSL